MTVKQKQPVTKKESTGSSPDQQVEDFVMVPDHLTMDAAEVRKKQQQKQSGKPSPASTRRHTVSGAGPTSGTVTGAGGGSRPASLAVQPNPMPEPIPVPSMKAAYQQLQQSLARSRTKSGDSVSAMSGVSSASGGSTLGPLPEEGVAEVSNPSPSAARRSRAASLSSPASSPKSPNKQHQQQVKTRRTSAPPSAVPDICQLSPPQTQYTLGTPPLGHRRRTSSSSSGATTPPPSVQFAMGGVNLVSPAAAGAAARLAPVSPVRGPGSRLSGGPGAPIPCLSPILGSPNKNADPVNNSGALMQWNHPVSSASRAVTVPENLCALPEGATLETPTGTSAPGAVAAVPGFRRRSAELQLAGGAAGGRANVVLNYGDPVLNMLPGAAAAAAAVASGNPPYDTGRMLTRRHSLTGGGMATAGGKENDPFNFATQELSEETLLAPEHNEILAKLKFIAQYVDTIIDVARFKAAPLSVLTESVGPRGGPGGLDPNSALHRRVQQLLLYMRCLHLLSQSLDFSRAELKSKRLKPTTTVKNGKYVKVRLTIKMDLCSTLFIILVFPLL